MRFCRYFYVAGEEAGSNTAEDTVKDDDDFPSDHTHRNYDEAVDELTCGTHFLASAAHVPGCKRRHPARLGVARIPYIEPIGPHPGPGHGPSQPWPWPVSGLALWPSGPWPGPLALWPLAWPALA